MAFPSFVEVNLEDAERRFSGDNLPTSKRDTYFVAQEAKALHLALQVYKEKKELALPMSV